MMFKWNPKFKAYLALAMICLAPLGVRAENFEDPSEGDPSYDDASPVDTMSEYASNVMADNCTCPEDNGDSALKKFESCLQKQVKKGNKAFKTALRFLGESTSEFNQSLQAYAEAYKEDCLSGGSDDEEEPGDDESPPEDF